MELSLANKLKILRDRAKILKQENADRLIAGARAEKRERQIALAVRRSNTRHHRRTEFEEIRRADERARRIQSDAMVPVYRGRLVVGFRTQKVDGILRDPPDSSPWADVLEDARIQFDLSEDNTEKAALCKIILHVRSKGHAADLRGLCEMYLEAFVAHRVLWGPFRCYRMKVHSWVTNREDWVTAQGVSFDPSRAEVFTTAAEAMEIFKARFPQDWTMSLHVAR